MLYVLADQLDTDPWLLLAWRGRSREEVLDPLRGAPGHRPARRRASARALAYERLVAVADADVERT